MSVVGGGTPRLCLATESPDPSGVGRHLLDLASGALAAGFDVTVLADPATPLVGAAHELGARTLPLEHAVSLSSPGAFDLVHVHAGIGWEGHELTRLASPSGAPVVRTEHLPWLLTDEGQIAEYHESLRHVRRVIAVGTGVADSFAAAGVPEHHIVVVPNGIDLPARRRTRSEVRAEFGVQEEPLLLHVGRFAPQKRHDLLLAAMAHVVRDVPGARLLLVGDGPGRPPAEAAAATAGWGPAVRFLGRRDDVADLLGAVDALVLPSDFEGLPLVALEAMAAGTPVIGTDVTGIAELVDDEAGWPVPAGDAPALAQAMMRAALDKDSARRRAAEARRRYQRSHTLAAMQAATLRIYQELLGKERS